MIQVHIIQLFATQTIYDSSLGKILLFLGGPPVAPVFMIIFGYFITESKKSRIQLVIRGIKIIFLGLLLNVALNFNLIISVNKGVYDINLWPYIFGADILPLAGLSLIIIALLSPIWRINKRFVIPLLISLIFLSVGLGNFLLGNSVQQPQLKYIFSFFYGASNWSYFPLFPWLSYSLTGIVFYKIRESSLGSLELGLGGDFPFSALRSPLSRLCFGVLFLIFSTLTLQYALSISANLPAYHHHGLLFFLWVISFLSFYSFFIHEIEKMLGSTIVFKYLKWLGKNITIVYIIQWIIIGNIATEIYKTVSTPLYLILSFIAILLISSGICYSWIMLKIMLFKKSIKPESH